MKEEEKKLVKYTKKIDKLKKPKKKGFFNSIANKFDTVVNKVDNFIHRNDVQVSGPTSVKHDTSIKLTPDGAMDVENMPAEWKKIFKQAGITKGELKDKETTAILMDQINLLLEAQQKEEAEEL
mmetsp:Transcript_101737/g.152425  ORF Transcript_101737/g.152425 Transcript_101737/m.152425 type:complete len:124 (+) Transcript_101737:412-783(+)